MEKKLSKAVETLKNVRRALQNDADCCVLAALDEAIAELQRCLVEGDPVKSREAVLKALAVLSDILTCLGVTVELVKFFCS